MITGASGLLGTTLAPLLAKRGHEIVRHANSGEGDVCCDLTNRIATFALLDNIRPEVVVNLVGLTDVDRCEEDMQAAYLLNVKTVENLVAGMRNNANSFLIHISTDQIYDSIGPSREEEVHLTNVYALTKYAGELAAKLIPSTILRTNFFGQSLLHGRKSFSDWVLENLKSGNAITGFTDVVVNPLSMSTLSSMIARTVEKRIAGVFNLGSKGGISKSDFIFEIAKVYGLNSVNVARGLSTDMDFLAYRPKDMQMDCYKFESTFDVSLPSICKEIFELKKNDDAIAQ